MEIHNKLYLNTAQSSWPGQEVCPHLFPLSAMRNVFELLELSHHDVASHGNVVQVQQSG